MDENDREVSTLTDRAFRSLCVGDDAIYNDEISYGYSPFSCHKPLVEESPKRTHHRDSKKQGQHHSQKGTNDPQPQRQKEQKSMFQVSSFLKAFSATEKSCEGMLIKNGDMKDSNGESWDKSALRSIQRELSEFSPDYHNNLTDGHFSHNMSHPRHSSGYGSANKTGKDAALPSGKSSKTKNGKSTIKLRKLNIKNFFLHSEFSPFQTWRDFNSFPFAQEDIVTSILPTDNLPKWYDSPLYKQLTEAHRIETLHTEETQTCQKAVVEPPPPPPKPVPPPPPPKVLPKPSATLAEKRCSSEGGEGSAPWRRNRSRANSAAPVNQPVVSKTVEDNLLSIKKEAKSVEVKAIEEVNSLASTPFSICQLMTPLIPSRQPTETSEILQTFLSPSALDLPLRPDSEAKTTPEPPIKRDSYKSLASSILFNLKDNRKRVKSRYSPTKFKTSELVDRSNQSPRLDLAKRAQACADGTASGFSTPAILKDGQPICSPIMDPANTPTVGLRKYDTDRPISDDYLISNLLQTKREASGSRNEENTHSKKNKSSLVNKQSYPSLNLYKKASPVDNEMKHLQVPLTTDTQFPMNKDHPTVQNKGSSPNAPIKELSQNTVSGNNGLSTNVVRVNQGVSPNVAPSNKGLSPNSAPDKGLSPNVPPVNQGVSPNILSANEGLSPNILPGSKEMSPDVPEKEGLSPNISVNKGHSPNVPDNVKRPVKDVRDTKEKYFGTQPAVAKEKCISGQPISTMDVIKAAREAINAAKNKALSATQSDSAKKSVTDTGKPREREIGEHIVNTKELIRNSGASSVTEINNVLSPNRTEESDKAMVNKNSNVKREPPPVPKRSFARSDIQLPLDTQQTAHVDIGHEKTDLSVPKGKESVKRQGRFKHIFSARQNNYIKSQRCVMTEDEQEQECEDEEPKENTEDDEMMMSAREMKDSEQIVNDLHALKELERARLGDRVLENAKNKLDVININEEAKAKNDLISRELRNIKRGMLSMRGNTFAKRDMFTKREQEQSKHEIFTKIDSNVIVNKALINDNYDKAKMALEEIISDRLKYKSGKEQDANSTSEENAGDGSRAKRVQRRKKSMQDSIVEAEEMQNGGMSVLREKEMRERLRDLRDHNHLKLILSQAEAKLGETHRLGGKMALPGMDRGDGELNNFHTNKYKYMKEGQGKHIDNRSLITDGPVEENKIDIARQMSDENGDNLIKENGGDRKKGDAPPVPPRSKKGTIRQESFSNETESAKDEVEEDISDRDSTNYKVEPQSVKEMSTVLRKYEPDSEMSAMEMVTDQNKIRLNKELWEEVENAMVKDSGKADVFASEPVVSSKHPQTENNRSSCLSLREERGDESKSNNRPTIVSPKREAKSESNNSEPQEPQKVKRKAPLKPDCLNALEQEKTKAADDTVTKNPAAEEPDKTKKATESIHLDEEALSETARKMISPLLQLNGINIDCQSPPDHGSLSSKSSYFSAESALHRNTETESNVYHSFENLMGELEEADGLTDVNISGNVEGDSERAEMEYYSVSDHESEADADKRPVVSPRGEKETSHKENGNYRGREVDNAGKTHCPTDDVNNQKPVSPSNTFSPTLGIPALFKVKDNTTFSSKVVKPVQPWSPRESLSGSERGEEELHHLKENPEVPFTDEVTTTTTTTTTTGSSITAPDASYQPKETLTHHSPLTPFSDSNLLKENPKESQFGAFLTVPQEENRNSDVSPLSEGAESFAISAADTGDEMVSSPAAVNEVSKVPSERSGSTCSGNDSQIGLPKPPAVLPKSEKALLKAMKLTTRRIKKEEAQNKLSPKSSHSSSKHRENKQRTDNSEHKSSEKKSSSSRSGSSGDKHHNSREKHHRERTEQRQHHSESHSEGTEHGDKSEQSHHERKGHSSEKRHHDRSDHTDQRRLSYDSERLPNVSTEHHGRSSERHIRDKPEHRHYSSDRVISDVPVYKAHISERPMSDRQYQRSQSIDRCTGFIGDKVERRLSTDMAVNDRLDPRSQRIEKSIMDELQQRGRARDRAGRDNLVKRSHSIDTYTGEVSHPPSLSRQSSHTSQLSRQSSIEHTIVTQSFPMTQRKLLQDPDSGQYFFVDMPVQIKTKTFFDPETGNYVQLPVQPPEGAVPQASPIEVLNTPVVLYHSFVPVPLSSMAQNSAVQASQMEQEEFEQRHVERLRQMHSKEGRPYLEPVYGQQDHMLGEFLGTEELDCGS